MSLPSAPEPGPRPLTPGLAASRPSPQDTALRLIAARLDLSPSIAHRSAGPAGLAVAYLPGERLTGMRVRDGHLEIHVVMAWPATVDDVVLDVGLAVGDLWDQDRVDLVIDDLALPDLGTNPIQPPSTAGEPCAHPMSG